MKVLFGGQAFAEGELQAVEIGFDEKIRAIGADLAGERIDCSGKIILPAMIDVHVHFRDFDQAHKEDWQTGSRAAIKGGVATVMEMPNTEPPTITLEMIRKKRALAEKSLVNFGLYGGIVEGNIERIEELAQEVDAFKLYMGETTGGLHITDSKLQARIFKIVAQTGKILTAHAQRGGRYDRDAKKITEAEAYDLERAIDMAVRYDTKLHLAHVTTLKGVEMIVKARKDGIDVTCETCPHYLFFTQEDFEKRGAFLKVNPPLASEEDREFLWEEAIPKGFIDMIASDHAPHTLEEKTSKAPAGVPGVETTLPLLLDAVNHKKLTLAKLLELCCVNPARRFGFAKKGKIAPDNDADFVIIDMSLRKEVEREELATKCGWSPYEGFLIKGWPVMTIVKGKIYTFEGQNVRRHELEGHH